MILPAIGNWDNFVNFWGRKLFMSLLPVICLNLWEVASLRTVIAPSVGLTTSASEAAPKMLGVWGPLQKRLVLVGPISIKRIVIISITSIGKRMACMFASSTVTINKHIEQVFVIL